MVKTATLISFILLILACCSFNTATYAQSLPINTCGILYTYDAAGNRTQRKYVCNNSGRIASTPVFTKDTSTTIQQVTELYPNPTTGRFTVSFSQPLLNTTVMLLDISGKVLQQSKKSGSLIVFDLSVYGAGIYTVRVMDRNNPISFKVVKQ